MCLLTVQCLLLAALLLLLVPLLLAARRLLHGGNVAAAAGERPGNVGIGYNYKHKGGSPSLSAVRVIAPLRPRA